MHMRVTGAAEEDRRDRGNYSVGSQVINQTYDYAVGLGSMVSDSLSGEEGLDSGRQASRSGNLQLHESTSRADQEAT